MTRWRLTPLAVALATLTLAPAWRPTLGWLWLLWGVVPMPGIWAQRAQAVAVAGATYGLTASDPFRPWRLASALALLGLTLAWRGRLLGSRRSPALPLTGAGATALLLLPAWAILAQHDPAAATALAGATTSLTLCAGWLLLLWPESPHPEATSPGAPAQASRALGLCAVVAAAMLPLGEGLAVAGLLATAAALGATLWHQRPRELRAWLPARASPMIWSGALWLGAGVVALVVGGEPWLRPRELARWAPLLAAPLAWAAWRSLAPPWHRRVGEAFVATLGLSALLALLLYILNPELDAPLLAPLRLFSTGHQAHVPGGRVQLVAGGFYLHRLKLAHVLVLGVALLLPRQVFLPLPRRRRLIEALLAALLLAALVFTFARGAWLGVGCGALVLFPWLPPPWRRAGLVAIALIAILAASLAPLRQRLASVSGSSAHGERARMWSQATRIIADHPLGAGLGNYPTLVRSYYDNVPPGTVMPPQHYAHHVVLSAWAESGAMGLLGLVGAFAAWLLACAAALAPGGPPTRRSIAATGLFAGVALWSIGLTHDVLYHKPVALAFAALAGIVIGEIGRSANSTDNPPLSGLPAI